MLKKLLILSIITIILISCSSDDTSELSKNEESKEKWKSWKIENYSINEMTQCYCAGILEWKLTVIKGKKDKVSFDETILPGNNTYDNVLKEAKTIDNVFDFIEDFDLSKVAKFSVVYNEKYGYPTSVFIDYDSSVVDDEIEYIYQGFEPID